MKVSNKVELHGFHYLRANDPHSRHPHSNP